MQNILLNNTQNINNISNNNQNIIISTNGITSEQTKMIEYFVMFQKFMNFSPEMDKQNTLNNNNENLANNSNYNEADNNNKNEKEKTEEIVNKDKGRRWNPIKRKKSKNYDKDVITNNNEKSKENINIIHKDINTKYADRIKNKINNEKNEKNYNKERNSVKKIQILIIIIEITI